MKICSLTDYKNKCKNNNTNINGFKLTLKVIDVDFENNIILFADITNKDMLIFQLLDQEFIKYDMIIDGKLTVFYQAINKHSIVSRILFANKSDEYTEKAHFTENKLKYLLTDEEIVTYI